MELSKRLKAVADLVSEGRIVADIGCDHGYIPIYLISSGRCPRVIAMDVKKGPLQHARTNIEKSGMKEYIDVRLSDGAAALHEGEADALLLSGMGGRLTNRILSDGFDRLGFFPELILQPQSEIETVRRFLREHGYIIADEDFVAEDGKYYPMIKAVFAGADNSDALFDTKDEGIYSLRQQDLFGPVLLRKRPEDYIGYLKKRKQKTESLLAKVTQSYKRDELLLLQKDLEYVLKHKEKVEL